MMELAAQKNPQRIQLRTDMISLIYARSKNHCIGVDGRIPWRLPDDFAHFKKTTMGKPIIMGRKTYEDHSSALPGRLNIVVTRQADYCAAEGVVVVNDLNAAIERAYLDSPEIFVIGGVAFFEAAWPNATIVYETVVDAVVEGDAILPAFDYSQWQTEILFEHPIDDRHEYAFKVYRHTRGQA